MRFVPLALILLVLAILAFTLPAWAMEAHDHSKMGSAGEFYSKWMRPKGEFSGIAHRGHSCCNQTDCSPVIELTVRDGQLWARVELAPNAWYRVPRSIMESNQPDPRETPDNRAHACVIGGQIACFVEGGGT